MINPSIAERSRSRALAVRLEEDWTSSMNEFTDEFITHVQQELVGMVDDWKYDYGADNKDCSAMLLWMLARLNPNAQINLNMIDTNNEST